MRRWVSLALIAAIVLASCASEPPSVDWCYVYDLAAGMPSGAAITSGDWIPGVGLAADETGELIVSFSEAFYIEPEYFSLKVVRLDDPGDISVVANVSIFGLDRLINETLPDMLTEAVVTREREDTDPLAAGNSVNATMQTTGAIAISQLEVGGFGASPFGTNPCGEPTPTPPPSETPAGTPTPTITPSQSMTPSMTHTAEATLPPYNCSVEYDFSVDDHDWYAIQANPLDPAPSGPDYGVYGGSAWNGQYKLRATNDYLSALSIEVVYHGISIDLSSVEWTFTKTSGAYLGTMREIILIDGYVAQDVDASTVSSGTKSKAVSYTGRLDDGEYINYYHAYHRDWTSPFVSLGSFALSSLKINGNCIPPTFTPTPTFTPSPVITNTPTITNTPNLTHSPTFTRTAVGGPGLSTATRTPSNTPIVLATWTPYATNTLYPSNTPEPTLPLPTLAATPTIITATPETYTPEFTYTPIPGTPTSFTTPGGTPWGTPVPWGTPWGTPDAFGELPGIGEAVTWLSTAAAEVGNLPGAFTGYIPNPNTGNLFGYVKWMMSCVSAQELLGQTIAPIACHFITGVTLAIILGSVYFSIKLIIFVFRIGLWIVMKIINVLPIVSFFMFIASIVVPIITAAVTFIGSYIIPIIIAVAAFFGSSLVIDYNQIINDIENFLEPVLRPILQIIEMLIMVVQIIVGLFLAVGAWLFQAIGIAVGLLSDFFTSPLTPIPGLPQCVTDPTAHQLCALYYIGDWTLFAPDTPGALIVPIIVVILDVVIVFFFVRTILSFLPSTEKATDAT